MAGPRGFLHVLVHSAESLPAADFKLLKKPTSDPYCLVSLGDQQHCTHTVYETTSPVWEHACSFQVGTFLPRPLLWLLGELSEAAYRKAEEPPSLEFDVLDEDLMTADDALGTASLEMLQVLQRPEEWHQVQLALQSSKGSMAAAFHAAAGAVGSAKRSCTSFGVRNEKFEGAGAGGGAGSLRVSLCWEPAPFLPAYFSRLAAALCLASGFAMLLLAASCRWQAPTERDDAPKQPGVTTAVLLGSVVLLLATMLEFITAHMESNARVDDLAANQSCHRGLSDALSSYGLPRRRGASASGRDAALLLKLRTTKLTQYEVSIIPTVDLLKHLHLPIVVLTYLLPFGGMALSLIAMSLQLLQAPSREIYAGQICNASAFFAAAAGLGFAFAADALPRARREEQKDKLKLFRQMGKAQMSEEQQSAASPSRARRRDVMKSKVQGLLCPPRG